MAALLAKHAGKRVWFLSVTTLPAASWTCFAVRVTNQMWVFTNVGELMTWACRFAKFSTISRMPNSNGGHGDVYDRIVIGRDAYDFSIGKEYFVSGFTTIFPHTPGHRPLPQGDRCTVRRANLYFSETCLPVPLSCLWLVNWPVLQKAKRTTLEGLQSLMDDKRLIGVLTGQYGNYGPPPSKSSSSSMLS